MADAKYGRIDEEGKLVITRSLETIDKSRDKVIHFAPIPEFDQLSQAVYQAGFVDQGDYIDAGVEIREVKQDDVVEIEPIIKEPIAKG